MNTIVVVVLGLHQLVCGLPVTTLPTAAAPSSAMGRIVAPASRGAGYSHLQAKPSSVRHAYRGTIDLQHDLDEISLWTRPPQSSTTTPLTKSQNDLILWMYRSLDRSTKALAAFEDAIRNLRELSLVDLHFLTTTYRSWSSPGSEQPVAHSETGSVQVAREALSFRDLAKSYGTMVGHVQLRALPTDFDRIQVDLYDLDQSSSAERPEQWAEWHRQYEAWRERVPACRTDRLAADVIYFVLTSSRIPAQGRDRRAQVVAQILANDQVYGISLKTLYGAEWPLKTSAIIDNVLEFWSKYGPIGVNSRSVTNNADKEPVSRSNSN